MGVSVGSPYLTINHGSTFMVKDLDGQINRDNLLLLKMKLSSSLFVLLLAGVPSPVLVDQPNPQPDPPAIPTINIVEQGGMSEPGAFYLEGEEGIIQLEKPFVLDVPQSQGPQLEPSRQLPSDILLNRQIRFANPVR